jgi:hypothetical protein
MNDNNKQRLNNEIAKRINAMLGDDEKAKQKYKDFYANEPEKYDIKRDNIYNINLTYKGDKPHTKGSINISGGNQSSISRVSPNLVGYCP